MKRVSFPKLRLTSVSPFAVGFPAIGVASRLLEALANRGDLIPPTFADLGDETIDGMAEGAMAISCQGRREGLRRASDK